MSRTESRRQASIAQQVRRVSWVTALIVIALLTVAASVVGYHYLRRQMLDHLDSLATLTALQVQAAALFEDELDATEAIQSLLASDAVQGAELRLAAGRVLAQAERAPGMVESMVQRWLPPQVRRRSIEVEGESIATLTLTGSNEPLIGAIGGLILSDLAVALALAALTIALAARYTRRIAQPLSELQQVMRRMLLEGDYARRAPPSPLHEVELLRSEFNALLDEIARRDLQIKEANAVLERLAFRDELTGLPNRAMFERARLAAMREARAGDGRLGMLYLDLDQFKQVNDRHGHEAGDRVLAAMGERLRAWQPQRALAARRGGDEFVVLLPSPPDAATMTDAVERLRVAAEAPVQFGSIELRPQISIGWAICPDTESDLEQLTAAADSSMYADKANRQPLAASAIHNA